MSFMQSNDTDFANRWPRVSASVKRILNMENVSPSEWQIMFSDVFSIVMWNESSGSAKIKESLADIVLDHIKSVHELVMRNQDESSLLKAYILQWSKFYSSAELLPLPFMHLETHLNGKHQVNFSTQRQVQESAVRKIMLECWNNTIYEKIEKRLMDSAIKLIQSERNGQVIDSSLVLGVRDSCVRLSETTGLEKPNYLTQLEQIYIDYTANFYRPLLAEYIQEKGVRSYTTFVSQKLLEEEERGKRYLKTNDRYGTMASLLEACVNLFVTEYMDQLLSEVPKLLREHDMDMLRQFYELISRVPEGSGHLLPLFEQHMRQFGLDEIRSNAEAMIKDPNKYVERLLSVYRLFSGIVKDAFNDDPMLLASRDKAYQEIVNDASVFSTDIPYSARSVARRVESRCPELLASYCDMMLRKSPVNRHLSSSEIEKHLENVLLVLAYVNSKDIFMRVYKAHLMRRLLLETSADSEMEEFMVDRLRNIGMPAEHINKMSRMFLDIKVSHDLTSDFKEAYRTAEFSTGLSSHAHSSTITSVDVVNILILTSGSWVLQSGEMPSTSLPSELEDFLPAIEDFYKRKHQGRNLIWQHHLSHGVLSFTSNHGRFELELTIHQIVVLYAWNMRFSAKLYLDSLLTSTGLQDHELRRTLWTLCEHPKMEQQLILYSPKAKTDREFTEATEFWLNMEFSNSKSGKAPGKRRLNLIGRLQLMQEATNEQETMAIMELRQLRAQEAIIKILKSRKRLPYAELYTELVELLRFQFVPSKRLIKEVLEWLIEQQYIRRHESDRDVFVYMT